MTDNELLAGALFVAGGVVWLFGQGVHFVLAGPKPNPHYISDFVEKFADPQRSNSKTTGRSVGTTELTTPYPCAWAHGPQDYEPAHENGGMRPTMRKIIVALFGALILCCTIDRAHAGQVAPNPAVVEEIYQRYSPRLKSLTRAKVENIWLDQAKTEPWYQAVYEIIKAGKDNPELANKLRREFPCEDSSTSRRDQTYAVAARQYRCTTNVSAEGIDASIVFYLNLDDTGRFESYVVYQSTIGATVKTFTDAGLAPNDALVLAELHSEVKSRIDNARAPPGGYVEYSKYFDTQKFAVRFK
jgi:hypothetical protein